MNKLNLVSRILLAGLLVGALYSTSLYSYLLFHILVEFFTIIIMSSIFFLAWNTRRWMDDNYFLFAGIAFLFVGLVELLHLTAYKGMDIFKGYDANLPTQLWVLARYMLSISLFIAPIMVKRRLSVWAVLANYFTVTLVALVLIFSGNFPVCFVEGTGLTQFKIVSEYIIILILIGAVFTLWANRDRFEPGILQAIVVFLGLSITAELAFTAYLRVYDEANLIGHLLMLVSYFLLYQAFIRRGLQDPFNLIFRDLKSKEAALKRSESDLQRLFDINPFPVVVSALSDSRLLKVNPAAADMYEINPAELEKYKGLDFYANPADRAKIIHKIRTEGKIQNELLELKNKSNQSLWCLVNSVQIELNNEQALLVGMVDITEQKHIQEELRYLSTHDALTGVFNRAYFETEMERLQKGRRFPVSIIMLDMDDLKQVNDTFGHSEGDKLLQTVASLVKSVMRGEEVFARIGGDEFAVLLPNSEMDAAIHVVARIRDQLKLHASKNGNTHLQVSIGIGVATVKEDLTEAFRRADASMYADKNLRKSHTKPLPPL